MEKKITLEFTAEELKDLSAALAAWRNMASEDKTRFAEAADGCLLVNDIEGFEQYTESYEGASDRFNRISKLHSKINRAR